MELCAPEFYDVWCAVVCSGEWDVRHAAAARATCRMFRALVDAFGALVVDCDRPDHKRFFVHRCRSQVVRDKVVTLRTRGRWHPDLVDRPLPAALLRLYMEQWFYHNLDLARLPRSLLVLEFGEDFWNVLNWDALPPNLRKLTVGVSFFNPPDSSLFSRSLRRLRLQERFYGDHVFSFGNGNPPPLLTHVTVGRHDDGGRLHVHPLPPSVHTIKVVRNLPIFGPTFPPSTKHLIFGDTYTETVPADALPPSLETLEFKARRESWPVDGPMPSSLTALALGSFYRGPVPAGSLPATLRSLHLGDCFSSAIDPSSLPPALTDLYLGASYVSDLDESRLPQGIVRLTVGPLLRERLKVGRLPRSLTELRVSWL